MYHFQKRILAYRMSEVVPAKLKLLVSLTGIFPTACVFEYNSSILSPSMTYSTAHQWSVETLCSMGGRRFAGRSGVARDSINRCSVCVDLSCFSVIGSLRERSISVPCAEPHSSISVSPKCVSRLTAFL